MGGKIKHRQNITLSNIRMIGYQLLWIGKDDPVRCFKLGRIRISKIGGIGDGFEDRGVELSLVTEHERCWNMGR